MADRETNDMSEKVCRKCGLSKPLELFYRDKGFKDGFKARCKACEQARKASDEVRAQSRKYNQSEKGQAAQKRYIKSGKKAVADKGKHERETHKLWTAAGGQKKCSRKYAQSAKGKAAIRAKSRRPEYRAWRLAYYRRPENLPKLRAYYRQKVQERTALKLSLPATFTESEWADAKAYFSERCAYCGEDRPLAQDHFVPLSAGGPYTRENIVPACKSCNSSKHDTMPEVWCQADAYRRICEFLNHRPKPQTHQLMLLF